MNKPLSIFLVEEGDGRVEHPQWQKLIGSHLSLLPFLVGVHGTLAQRRLAVGVDLGKVFKRLLLLTCSLLKVRQI